MKTNRMRNRCIWVLCGVLFIAFSGCGKKGPPLPPEIKGQILSAPYDVKYILGDTDVSLSWNHRRDETAAVKPEGFDVFMAKKTFDACEGCPFVFQKIGYIPMPSMEFVSKIEKGFNYYFRVQAVGDENMRSEFSETIQFEHK